jgi:hypothetical protein
MIEKGNVVCDPLRRLNKLMVYYGVLRMFEEYYFLAVLL